MAAPAMFAVQVTRSAALPVFLALAARRNRAVADMIERASARLDTDYPNMRWSPTFKPADVLVGTSAAVLVVASWRASVTAHTEAVA